MDTILLHEINKSLDEYLQKLFIEELRRGYRITSNLFKEIPILQTKVGSDLKPYIRRAAIEYCLEERAKKSPGIFSSVEYKKNKSGNYHHLELVYNSFIITTSYTKDSNEVPRDAIYRSQLMLNYGLFENQITPEKIYCILTYGGEKSIPDFLSLKIFGRDETHKTMFNHIFNEKENNVPIEKTDITIQLKLKRDIEKYDQTAEG